MTAPPHIFTLTGNLLAERTLEFDAWSPGRTQRAKRESFQVGGKGINVSKMLNRLQTPNTALCFTGGATGAECEAWLRERRFAYRAFTSNSATRAGSVVRTVNATQPETTFLGPDAAPDAAAVHACAEFLDARPNGEILAVCGSLPGWMEDHLNPLRAALARWSERGTLVADTYGPPLAWISGQPAGALIKINAAEFHTLVESHPNALDVATAIWPRSRWIVSDGGNEVWFAEAGQPAQSLAPPHVEEVSATGSGDILLACVLHALFVRGLPLREAVAFALPYAAANAAHPGIAEFADPT